MKRDDFTSRCPLADKVRGRGMWCRRREARGREEGEGRKCKRREEGHKEGEVSWAGGGEAYPLLSPLL